MSAPSGTTAPIGFDMVIVGVGGQGIVLLAHAIGEACVKAGVRALTGELHGLSQRSGSVYIHMRLGGADRSPIIPYGEAQAIIALEAMEALRYIEYLAPDGVVIVNRRVIHSPVETAILSREKRTDYVTYEKVRERLGMATDRLAELDALALAREAGEHRAENAVFLGALAALANVPLTADELRAGLAAVMPERALAANLRAFEAGYRAAYERLCAKMECREL